ncbi:hypothetical protein B4N89_36775 [Embleya scabrispora]|uniref:Uncharacterized protein n=1 Tax=Embleya scabrispora TaxID=159449 RepID=A0A1T3NLR5_9ACTN|nr:hypothetical protein B4N89_36775 [Embleya scabrispora]
MEPQRPPLRRIHCSASPSPSATRAGPTDTPAPLVSALNPTRTGSCGRSRPGVQCRAVDEHGIGVADGQVGELWGAVDSPRRRSVDTPRPPAEFFASEDAGAFPAPRRSRYRVVTNGARPPGTSLRGGRSRSRAAHGNARWRGRRPVPPAEPSPTTGRLMRHRLEASTPAHPDASNRCRPSRTRLIRARDGRARLNSNSIGLELGRLPLGQLRLSVSTPE